MTSTTAPSKDLAPPDEDPPPLEQPRISTGPAPNEGRASDEELPPPDNLDIGLPFVPGDWHPEPMQSIPLSKARVALIDDIIALYDCRPTIERIKRYTQDCIYDDQFVHLEDRYKIAGHWFAMPKLFEEVKNEGYEVAFSDNELILLKIEQSWTFKLPPGSPVGPIRTPKLNSLVTLALDPETLESDFIRVKHHEERGNDRDYHHAVMGFTFKKWQSDEAAKHMHSPEAEAFREDKATELDYYAYGEDE